MMLGSMQVQKDVISANALVSACGASGAWILAFTLDKRRPVE